MKQGLLRIVLLVSLFLAGYQEAQACHGVALISPTFTNTGSSIIVNGSSDPATCGCGPYYMEVEVACFSAANFTGNAPLCTATNWNAYPWYHALLNVPNYTAAAGWPDNCVTEPYSPVTVPFADLCPGTVYVLRARERVCAGSTGPWTSNYTFTTPGTAPSFSLTATANPNFICPGNPSVLTATLTGSGGCGSGSPTFTWNPGNLIGQTVTVTPTVTTIYTVTATGGYLTCYGVPPATVQVTVGGTATAGTATASPTTVCQGGCVTLTLTGNNGSIQWQSSPNGITWTNIAGATTSPYSYCPVNSAMYFRAVVTGPAGCGTATSNIVTVGITPVPTLSINPGSPSICVGQSVTLNVTGSSGYTWYSAPSVSIGTGSSVTVSPTVTTTYTVSTSATCPATQTVTVTVNPLPVINFSPSGPSICAGSAVTIDAGPSTANYTWTPATGLTYLSPSHDSVSASPATTTSYNVTAQTAAGCTASGAITVTVNPNPVLVPSANPVTICPNTTDTVTMSGANTYTWNPLTGANILNASGSMVEFSPATSTTYTVVGTTTAGCVDSTTVVVNVTNNIVVDAGLPDSICPGQTTVLTATGGTIYNWTPNAGIVSGGATDTPTVSPTVTTTYTVNVANQYGCTGVDSVEVFVHSLPVPDAGLDTGLCAGASIILNGSGGGSYIWSGAGIVSGGTTATPTVSPAVTTDYVLTVTDGNNCQSNDTVTVVVHPLPLADAGQDQFICGSNCATLNASGGVTYQWNPATGLSAPTSATTQACPAATTIYEVTVTDTYGCTDKDSVKVVVYPPLSVTVSSDDSICPGGQSSVSANALGGDGGPYSYSWSPTTGLATPYAASSTASPAVTTTYVVTVTDQCGSPAVQDSVIITVFSLPQLSVTPDITEGCSPVCVDFTGSSQPAAVSCTYNFGDNTTANTCNATHCFTVPGDYTIVYTATDIHGCQNTITYTNLITVHPNPVAGFMATPQTTSILSPQITFTPTCTNCDTTIYFVNYLTDTTPITNLATPFTYTYTDPGTYTILQIAVNQWGCIDTTMSYVVIEPDWSFFAPNAFTPNGDGHNDVFMVYGEGIDNSTFEMWIFDRWGNPVFTSTDMAKGWDGKVQGGDFPVQVDTYVWRVKFRDINGNPHSYIGGINLIR